MVIYENSVDTKPTDSLASMANLYKEDKKAKSTSIKFSLYCFIVIVMVIGVAAILDYYVIGSCPIMNMTLYAYFSSF